MPACASSFADTATTEIYTLSLHDALPISGGAPGSNARAEGIATAAKSNTIRLRTRRPVRTPSIRSGRLIIRSEEHTSELQSRENLVCRLLLEKKKKNHQNRRPPTSNSE